MQAQIKKKDFSGQNFYCGFDTHNKSWSVTIETDELTLRTFTQKPDVETLVHHLKKHYPGGTYIAGYEAGYFGYGIQRKFASYGIDCLVLHPADIPTTHKEKDQKTDPRDSRKIAKALSNKAVHSIWIPTLAEEQDRQLLRTRRALSKDVARTKNRIKAFLQIHGITDTETMTRNHWSRRVIKRLEEVELNEPTGTEALRSYIRTLNFLRNEILSVSRCIRTLARSSRYEVSFNKLIKIKGIGAVTAMTLLTEIGDIKRFKNPDKFRSYIGLIPTSHSSGEKDYQGRITPRANAYIRYLIIEAAWTAIRSDSDYLYIYREYKKRMKENKALVRTANKMANRIYYCLKNEDIE